VLTACQDRNIRVYSVSNGKQSRTFKGSAGEDGTLIKVRLLFLTIILKLDSYFFIFYSKRWRWTVVALMQPHHVLTRLCLSTTTQLVTVWQLCTDTPSWSRASNSPMTASTLFQFPVSTILNAQYFLVLLKLKTFPQGMDAFSYGGCPRK
jgi:hypothetical protein